MNGPLRMPRRSSRPEWRIFFVALLMLAGMGVLVAKLWWEQVARGPYWSKRIASRSEVTVRIPSVRGEIRDRNGITLVSNRASYEVDFYLPDMVRGYRQQNEGHLPTVKYKAPVRQMLTEKSEADIVKIVNDSIIPRLQDLNLARDYNAARLQRHFRNDTEVPFTYLEELNFETLARFSEHNLGLPGVDIALRPVREYRYRALAAHLLGYVGAPNDIDRLPDVRNYTFYQPDVEGKTQIEHAYDKYLRGTPGVRVMQRNVKGVIEGEVRKDPAKQGNHLYLTIDARIQYIAERALREAGVGRGSVVVVDPSNGDILAMASIPSYDPNTFIPSISVDQWETLTSDDTDPLTNRAIQGYAPGSTFKAVTGLAGLRAGIPSGRAFDCGGGAQYGAKFMMCWVTAQKMSPHGSLTLPDAIKHSCNGFFYRYGNEAGIDNILAISDALGLGKQTGVPLTGESKGLIPGPDWLKSVSPNERWSNGYTANVSIGQGAVECSPLQMTMVTATIANRGISYYPRLVSRIITPEGVDLRDEHGNLVCPLEPRVRADLHQANIKDEDIELVREGMKRVVATGTGKKAQIKGVTVAGKTGTAQFWRLEKQNGKAVKVKDNHVWFISFAPFDQPKFACTVFVQGAKSGGGVAAPIAQRVLEESLSLEKGFDPGLQPMDPAMGSFAHIEAVDYKASAVPAEIKKQIEVEDRETADHTDGPSDKKLVERQIRAQPDIREDADQAGSVSRGNKKAKPRDRRNIFEKIFGPKRERQEPRERRTPFNPFRR